MHVSTLTASLTTRSFHPIYIIYKQLKQLFMQRACHLEALAVGEVQLGDVQMEAQPGYLVIDLQVDGLIWLDANDLQPTPTPSITW